MSTTVPGTDQGTDQGTGQGTATAEGPAPAVASPEAAPQAAAPRPGDSGPVWGTGRRKTSIARVRIRAGTGKVVVNGIPHQNYFHTLQQRLDAVAPLRETETLGRYDVFASVQGGGKGSQAGAVLLGVARALKTDNPSLEPLLREKGLLTRDSRKVERKKYGRHKARRSVQYSKR